MKACFLVLLTGLALLLAASDKRIVGSARGENQDLTLQVTLYLDPASVKDLIGSDLGGHFIVADVKIDPKYGKEIEIDRDSFSLRTDKNGEKATPFAPSQIVGKETLVVSQQRIGGNEGSILYGNRAPTVNGPAVVKDASSPGDQAVDEGTRRVQSIDAVVGEDL